MQVGWAITLCLRPSTPIPVHAEMAWCACSVPLCRHTVSQVIELLLHLPGLLLEKRRNRNLHRISLL